MSKFDWKVLDRNYEDVIYETYNGIAKITINRPEVRNAFRPKTVMELIDAFTVAREDNEVGVIVLTGANHGKGEDKEAFCSGGDQSVRGHGGYVGEDNVPRLNVLDLQRLIRVIPKRFKILSSFMYISDYSFSCKSRCNASYISLDTLCFNDRSNRFAL